MDWWKLFALLVAVAVLKVTAEGPKKKIRIHLPQKVKHIHHHKKIYITNHPAPSQYAPAYLPSADGAVAVPTNVALPSVASIVPLNSVELYDDPQNRLPVVAPAASKLLPLYRARGYYGPNHSDWEEQEYDLEPPPEPADYPPPAFSAPGASGAASSHYPPKRVKIVKLNDVPRKKVVRKVKPKRVVIRGRPQPEEEHPVSSFHEQFYSDLEGTGTVRKIKKPQRVEKIIDGDTEHIHTYSEEHIHKLVFDDRPKLTGLRALAGDHAASMTALAAAHPLIPLKNAQTLLAYNSDPFTGLTAVGSMGTPSHLEYAAYNPRDVTHDHIFHDHGEITSDVDITKDSLSFPPKVSYNSQGLRISGSGSKRNKVKSSHKYAKPTKPSSSSDFSYYESIYAPKSRPKKVRKPTPPTQYHEPSSAVNFKDVSSSFKVKDKSKLKSRYIAPSSYSNSQLLTDYRLQQASVPAPFSLSTTVVHDYKPNTAQAGYTNFKDPFGDFKDSYSSNFEYDTYASSSNVHASENNNEQSTHDKNSKNKKKSISTQNMSFGGTAHQNIVDHLEDPNDSGVSIEDDTPSAEISEGYQDVKPSESVTSTPYTIRESSPAHPYYSAMALKALHGDQMSIAESSNDVFQYVEAPTPSVASPSTSIATTASTLPVYFSIKSTAVTTQTADSSPEPKPKERRREKRVNNGSTKSESKQRYTLIKDYQPSASSSDTSVHRIRYPYQQHTTDSSTVRGKLKYGDKI